MKGDISYFNTHDPTTGISQLRVEVPSIPPEAGLAVGEVAHQLRAALDNMVWLVLRSEGVNHSGMHRLQFPIHESAEKYPKDMRGPSLKGASPQFADAVFALQPFNSAAHSPSSLGHLNRINILDKHRVLLPSLLALMNPIEPAKISMNFQGPIEQWRAVFVDNTGVAAESAALVSIEVVPPTTQVLLGLVELASGGIDVDVVLDTEPRIHVGYIESMISDVREACRVMAECVRPCSERVSVHK